MESHLKSCGAPVHKVDGFLGLDGGYGGVDVLWNNVSSIEKADGHIFSLRRVALHHLVAWLEASLGDRVDAHRVVVGHLGGDQGRVGDKGEMNARIGHLKFTSVLQLLTKVSLTRLVWNSFKSTFRAPSNLKTYYIFKFHLYLICAHAHLKEAVTEERTWAMILFKFV